MIATAAHGEFTNSSLPLMLKDLHNTSQTGRLFLEAGALRGFISYKDGAIIDATLGMQFGEMALLAALQINHGRYNFRSSSPSGRASINSSLESILAKLPQTPQPGRP